MFKKITQLLFPAAAFAVLPSCSNVQSGQQLPVAKEGNVVHVVELFTSEGCSSCPPADRLLGKLKAEGDSGVFVLSYHVDYWNHLGWKDPFSQAAFSNRQRDYARRFALESVYTPQAVVDGREEFTGSDEKRLRASLAKGANAAVAVKANAILVDKNTVRVAYSLSAPAGLVLNVALVQAEAKTDVKRGENGGRTLAHVNVVRELKTTDAKPSGSVDVSLPDGLAPGSLSLLLFVQQKSDGRITGAVPLAVPLQKEA